MPYNLKVLLKIVNPIQNFNCLLDYYWHNSFLCHLLGRVDIQSRVSSFIVAHAVFRIFSICNSYKLLQDTVVHLLFDFFYHIYFLDFLEPSRFYMMRLGWGMGMYISKFNRNYSAILATLQITLYIHSRNSS